MKLTVTRVVLSEAELLISSVGTGKRNTQKASLNVCSILGTIYSSSSSVWDALL